MARKRNQRGFSMIEVMIASTLVAIISITFVITFSNIAKLSAKIEANATADEAVRTVRAVLGTRDLCDNALRMTHGMAGTKVSYAAPNPVAPQAINLIEFNSISNPAQQAKALWVGAPPLSASIQISAIDFIEASNPATGVPVGRSTLTYNGVVYNVYTGFIQLTFASYGSAKLAGGPPIPRQVPIVIAVSPAGTIDYCYSNIVATQTCAAAGGTLSATWDCTSNVYSQPGGLKGYNGCPAACPAAAVGCVNTVTITHFDTQGRPICECQNACH